MAMIFSNLESVEVMISIQKKNIQIKKDNDLKNIAFLMFLYFLQGIPLGLTASLPYILSSKNISYSYQAIFSFASWPFAIKLFWAPIVDSLYIKRIGKRKSWLVPIQYLIGFFLILFSYDVHEMIDTKKKITSNGKISYIYIFYHYLCDRTNKNNKNFLRNLYIDKYIFYVYLFGCNSRYCCRWLGPYHFIQVIKLIHFFNAKISQLEKNQAGLQYVIMPDQQQEF